MFKTILVLAVCFLSINAFAAFASCRGKLVKIDGYHVKNIDDVHAAFAKSLDFPSYYGNNFDALYDMLVSMDRPVCIRVSHKNDLKDVLGIDNYYGLELTLADAQENNLNISVSF